MMRIIGRKIILKLKRKKIGNKKLCEAIDKLIDDLKVFNPVKDVLSTIRKDADCVQNEGFYFFDINVYRILILIEFDEEGEATIIWAGTHQEHERIFKNNKTTIEKWFKDKNYIE